jgi:hypothetical protein
MAQVATISESRRTVGGGTCERDKQGNAGNGIEAPDAPVGCVPDRGSALQFGIDGVAVPGGGELSEEGREYGGGRDATQHENGEGTEQQFPAPSLPVCEDSPAETSRW